MAGNEAPAGVKATPSWSSALGCAVCPWRTSGGATRHVDGHGYSRTRQGVSAAEPVLSPFPLPIRDPILTPALCKLRSIPLKAQSWPCFTLFLHEGQMFEQDSDGGQQDHDSEAEPPQLPMSPRPPVVSPGQVTD